MNPIHWFFFISTAGISLAVTIYGMWVRSRYAMPGFATSVTGCEVARLVLDKMGMVHVSVTPVEPPEHPEDYLMNEGFFMSKSAYDGRDLTTLVQVANQAFLKGQLSNLVFWIHLKRKIAFAAGIAVVAGWICFIAGVLFGPLSFLMQLGLGAFTVVMIFAFLDLPFELEKDERTSRMIKDANFLEPHELACFGKLNRARALDGLSCLIRLPLQMLQGAFRSKRHGF